MEQDDNRPRRIYARPVGRSLTGYRVSTISYEIGFRARAL
jgi:hypothetical protein